MKLFRCLLAFSTLAAAAATACAAVEFVGVLIMPGRSLFALSADGGPSAWRTLGQDFAGYAIAEFDPKTDTLTLTRTGDTVRVRLKDDARVRTARLELTGKITLGAGEQIEVSRVTLPLGLETVLPLKDGLVWRITPTRRPDGNLMFRLAAERTTPDGNTEKLAAPAVIVLPGQSFKIAVGDLAFAFAPTNPPSSP